MIRSLIHIIFFSLLFLQLQGQSVEDKRTLRSLFKTSKTLWFKTYEGSLDDTHPIHMTLATDGSLWKGWYTMDDGRFTKSLDGSSKGNTLTLYEIDEAENYCAELSFDIMGDDLEGSWKAVHARQRFEISLSQQKSSEAPCELNAINIYSASQGNKKYQLTLSLEGDNLTQCVLELNGASFTLDAICKNEDCSELVADVSNIGGSYKEIIIRLIDENTVSLKFGKDSSNKPMKLLLNQSLSFKCIELVNYTHKIDLIYPEIKSDIFNNWITGEFREALDLASETTAQSEDFDCKDRWSAHSFGWVDIHYFDKDLVSGVLVYQLAHDSVPVTKAFVFDLEKNTKLSEKSIFEKKYNSTKVLEEHTSAYKKQLKARKNDLLSKPLAALSYPHLSLSKDGVLLTADYSTLLGNQNILISYTDLKAYLQKSISKKFIKD